jgi:hypothetical protein
MGLPLPKQRPVLLTDRLRISPIAFHSWQAQDREKPSPERNLVYHWNAFIRDGFECFAFDTDVLERVT